MMHWSSVNVLSCFFLLGTLSVCAATEGTEATEATQAPPGTKPDPGDDADLDGLGDPGAGGSDGDGASGCRKVDLLFVIDNSVSMSNEQDALVGSFPGFMAALKGTLDAANDYHVMVVDTDEWGRCNTANPWQGVTPDSNTCNDYIQATTFDECDRTWGAGVIHPAGKGATNAICTPAGGNRYIVEGEPDLAGTFACMGKVGLAGHPKEQPMVAAAAALSAELNAPGGCNAGFLRDDAILVVTFITDEPSNDKNQPSEWYDWIVAAKGGDPSAIVMLGLVPPPSPYIPDTRWSDFIAMWGSRGIEGSISEPDYAPFFATALTVIDETCDEFEAPLPE